MKFERRPWGWFLTLFHGKRFWVKIIRAKGRLSLQSHARRTEYHLGLQKIQPHDKHRIQNGIVLEIATGDPNEDDIVRYEDDYGRIN
jgi:hypothetical protein